MIWGRADAEEEKTADRFRGESKENLCYAAMPPMNVDVE